MPRFRTRLDHGRSRPRIGHTQPGYTPLVTLLTPPGVDRRASTDEQALLGERQLSPPPPVLSTAPVANTGGTVSPRRLPGGRDLCMTAGSEPRRCRARRRRSPPLGRHLDDHDRLATARGRRDRGGTRTSPGRTDPSTTPGNGRVACGDWHIGEFDDAAGSAVRRHRSANASFCSYHSDVFDAQSDQTVSYVVQPWTAFTSCDEPDVPAVPPYAAPGVLEKSAGQRLVSPLSQSSMAAIVNPVLNGWFGPTGSEIDDHNGPASRLVHGS